MSNDYHLNYKVIIFIIRIIISITMNITTEFISSHYLTMEMDFKYKKYDASI
jgi:hypothetical protein